MNVAGYGSKCACTPLLSRDSNGAVCESFTQSNVVRAHRSITVAAQKPGEVYRVIISQLVRVALLAHFVVAAMSGQQIYDLLLKNGHVIDPANKRNGRLDIAIVGNKIARVGADLPASHARVVVDAGQYYVTPGLIDIHTHFDAQ